MQTAKTFSVPLKDGAKGQAVQLATFAHYVAGKQFRFVVTMLEGYQAAVTHRASGMRVCSIPPTASTRTQVDAKRAGVEALRRLIERVGEPLVAAKLSEAES